MGLKNIFIAQYISFWEVVTYLTQGHKKNYVKSYIFIQLRCIAEAATRGVLQKKYS